MEKLTREQDEEQRRGLSGAHARAWLLFVRGTEVVAKVETEVKTVGGVTLDGLRIIRALVQADENRMTVNKLAAKLKDTTTLSRSAVSRLTDRLEEAGLVYKDTVLNEKRKGEDGRTISVVLTQKGAETYNAAWPAYGNAIKRHFVGHLRNSEAIILGDILERMITKESDEPNSKA